MRQHLRKDEALDRLADEVNVAQFVAFRPRPERDPEQTFARVLGEPPGLRFADLRAAIRILLERAAESRVNVRSFSPDDPKSKPFAYGLRTVDEAEAIARARLADGLWIIINETVDQRDGGFSGVAEAGIAEFAPDDIPRCVEKPGTCRLSTNWAERLVRIVYGHDVSLSLGDTARFEFSVHPGPRGWRGTPLLGWEIDASSSKTMLSAEVTWPNRYSRFLGDKTFGLLMAHLAGERVPKTTAFVRRLPRGFTFGEATETAEVWVRSSPREQGLDAGRFRTVHGWWPPAELLAEQDPEPTTYVDPDTNEESIGFILPSALVQQGILARWSGKTISQQIGAFLSEGREGYGDAYMRGDLGPESLPNSVMDAVAALGVRLRDQFGPVEYEWVHDGSRVWVVQLQQGIAPGSGDVIVPGEVKQWRCIRASADLEEFRQVVSGLGADEGVLVVGRIGLTSHKADVLRRARRPTRMGQPESVD